MTDSDKYGVASVTFSWDAHAANCERNNVRCPQCRCLHVWTEGGPPDWCSSCGIEFVWPGRALSHPDTDSKEV